MKKISTRSISLIALFLAGISLLGSNLYFASGESGKINGCVNKKTQLLRISEKCTATESKISWSMQGPTGPTGPKGDSTQSTNSILPIFPKVLDANGKILGDFLGANQNETTLLVGRARVTYNFNGTIQLNGTPFYLDDKCAGDKYAGSDTESKRAFSADRPMFSNDDSIDPTKDFFIGVQIGEALDWKPFYMKRADTNLSKPVTCIGPFENGGDQAIISPKMYKLVALNIDILPRVPSPLVIK